MWGGMLGGKKKKAPEPVATPERKPPLPSFKNDSISKVCLSAAAALRARFASRSTERRSCSDGATSKLVARRATRVI